MPKYTRKILVALKKETTYGVAPTLAAANCFRVTADPSKLTPLAGQAVERDFARPYKGNSSSIQTEFSREFSFDVELQGSGAAGTAPKYADALLGCGLAETVTATTKVEYKPVSSNEDSVTIDPYIDDLKFQLTGARGNVSLNMARAGIPKLSFNFKGRFIAPADATPLTPDFTGWQDPLGVNSANTPTVTLFGQALTMESFNLDLANELAFIDPPGGAAQALIPNRKPAGTLVLQLGAIAAYDWVAAAKNKTAGALQIVHGTVAGKIVQIDAPNVTINAPSFSDVNGIVYVSCPLVLEPTSAGNDELVLTFK